MFDPKKKFVATFLSLIILILNIDAFAENYPNKPLRLVLGFAPGGASDIVSRIVAKKLTEQLGQQVILDNRAAATGTVAANIVAKSNPDGYTLLCAATSTMAVNPFVYPNTSYDSIRDFSAVAQMVSMPNVLVIHPSLKINSIAEFITYANRQNGQLSYVSAGIGSSNHMAAALFTSLAKIKMVHIPYKGGGPALVDVIAGQVPVDFATIVSVIPYIKNSKLRAIGVTSLTRTKILPDIPTIAESGVNDYESTILYGIVMATGGNKVIIEKLNSEINKVLLNNEVKNRFFELGAEPAMKSPLQFGDYIKSEMKKWGKVVKEAGIKID